MPFAETSLHFDPVWPWSLPRIGPFLLAGVGIALVLLTLWTYRGVSRATRSRVLLLIALRLAALAVVLLLMARPVLVTRGEENLDASRLHLLLDVSKSMDLADEIDNLPRYEAARRLVFSPRVAAEMRRLTQEKKVEFVWWEGAVGLRPLDPKSGADGKRTDMGLWLHELRGKIDRDDSVRGLLLFSDGADNGTRYQALKEAAFFKGRAPLHAFGLGRTTTAPRLRNIALTDIAVEPNPVPIRGKIQVTVLLDAPGFENTPVDIGLHLEDPLTGKMNRSGTPQRVFLKKTRGNKVTLQAEAPDKPGEIKVLVRIENPSPDDVASTDDAIATYLPVTKEGVSILWVEGKRRAYESVFALRFSLSRSPRFQVEYAEKIQDAAPRMAGDDFFGLGKKHYDVVVLGDISAQRFSDGKPEVFATIRKLVEGGTGLLMLGGYESFAGSDWNTPLAADLARLLPVELDRPGQVEQPVKVVPTEAGSQYILRLSDVPQADRLIWEKEFAPLDGMTHLGTVKPTGTVLARSDGPAGEPVLVGGNVGRGRVLVFGGDTTWKAWRRTKDALPAYERFWQQMMLWLARQEETEGQLQLRLDSQRVAAGADERLGFTVELLGKDRRPLSDPRFEARVVAPSGKVLDVPIVREGEAHRGWLLRIDEPGEYRVEATGTAREKEQLVKKSASARFMGHAEDPESMQPAANHDFLGRLAAAGGGRFHPAEESRLLRLLEELTARRDGLDRVREERWPNWNSRPPEPRTVGDQIGTLLDTMVLPMLLLFVGAISTEWVLRRRWGLV